MTPLILDIKLELYDFNITHAELNNMSSLFSFLSAKKSNQFAVHAIVEGAYNRNSLAAALTDDRSARSICRNTGAFPPVSARIASMASSAFEWLRPAYC